MTYRPPPLFATTEPKLDEGLEVTHSPLAKSSKEHSPIQQPLAKSSKKSSRGSETMRAGLLDHDHNNSEYKWSE